MTTESEKLQRDDDEFAAQASRRLRTGVDELDAATLSRLNRARQVALDVIDSSTSGTGWRNRWLPVGVTAVLAIFAVTVWQGRVPEPTAGELLAVPIVADDVADFELLLDDGDLAMYEDLEFFVWLPEDELENIG